MKPEGTRDYLPPEAEVRASFRERLEALFSRWGYRPVELSALEPYDATHPNADRAFKLVDKTGEVLMLRSEFTTALARVLLPRASEGPFRLRYAGKLWLREAAAEPGRLREFTQVGVELVGISSPAADAELVELAWEALVAVGLEAAVIEIGLPALVRDLLEATGLPADVAERLRRAVDRKAVPELAEALSAFGVEGKLREAILALPDLYGGREVLQEAKRHALSDRARLDLEWLEAVASALPPALPLMFDLGMARRYDYYSGLTFRAYTPDFGLPLLGGGRYDGALLPMAAGFAVGLERVLEAAKAPPSRRGVEVVAADVDLARRLRAEGRVVELAHTDDRAALLALAKRRGARYLAVEGKLVEVTSCRDTN